LQGTSLCVIAALLPLPFGGIKPWTWELLSGIVGLLLLHYAWRVLRGDLVAVPADAVRFSAVAFLLIVVWIVVQAVPFTPSAWHNAAWDAARRVLGGNVPGAISLEPFLTWTALMRLLTFASIFWLALQTGFDRVWAQRFLTVLLVSGTAYAVYGLIIQFTQTDFVLWFPFKRQHNLLSTFLNRDHFATYIGLCFLVACAMTIDHGLKGYVAGAGIRGNARTIIEALTARGTWPLVAALIMGTTLLLTHSRAGFVSTLAGLAGLLYAMAVAMRAERRTRWAIGLAVVLFLGLIVALSGQDTITSVAETDLGSEERFPVYAATLSAISDNYLLGTGLGTFEWAFQPYAPLVLIHYFTRAHNDYLELLLELGVPAALLYFASLAALVAICIRSLHRGRNHLLPCLAIGATVLVGTHALLDFSLQVPAVATVYVILLGSGIAQALNPQRGRSHSGGSPSDAPSLASATAPMA
jgi:O-antigen ligase